MDQHGMYKKLDHLLDEVKVAILVNIGEDGTPVARWMSPTLVRGREGFIYAITSPDFLKTKAIEENPKVMWMLQTPSLNEIMTIKGHVEVISNPDLQAMVQESIGSKLVTFWKMNRDMSKVVILETRIESYDYSMPNEPRRERVKVHEGAQD